MWPHCCQVMLDQLAISAKAITVTTTLPRRVAVLSSVPIRYGCGANQLCRWHHIPPTALAELHTGTLSVVKLPSFGTGTVWRKQSPKRSPDLCRLPPSPACSYGIFIFTNTFCFQIVYVLGKTSAFAPCLALFH